MHEDLNHAFNHCLTFLLDKDIFKKFIVQSKSGESEKELIPKLEPLPINCFKPRLHFMTRTLYLVQEAGSQLFYLPPYSPDLNKIEHWWAVLKTWMRQRLTKLDKVSPRVDAAFYYCPNLIA